MELKKEEEIFYSPSLEIENKDTKHGLTISTVGKCHLASGLKCENAVGISPFERAIE